MALTPNDRLIVATSLLGAFAFGILVATPMPLQIAAETILDGIGVQHESPATHEPTSPTSQWVDVQLPMPEPLQRDEFTVDYIPSPEARWYPVGLVPCVQEDDGQFVDCYWDAHVRGNGTGTSFYAVNGVFTLINR